MGVCLWIFLWRAPIVVGASICRCVGLAWYALSLHVSPRPILMNHTWGDRG